MQTLFADTIIKSLYTATYRRCVREQNGPDIIENMLCLCPNHHNQFDKFSFYIDYETLKIKKLEGYEDLKLNLNQKHKLDREFLRYHYQNYLKNNP